jgi:type II secretory pathway pseudopilin PulG
MNLKAHSHERSRFAAFTLIEGMIGVAVMGVVFVSLYTGMASGFQSIRTAQENLRATQVMTEKFEAIRLYNWEQVNTPGFIPDTFTAKYAPNASNPGITYNGTIRISPMGPEPYTTDMRMVTVVLTWQSGPRTNTRVLTSYVGRYGLQNYVY